MTATNVVGLNRTAVVSGGLGNMLLSGLIDSPVHCMIDQYTVVGGSEPTTGSTIKLFATGASASTSTTYPSLPTGANILAIGLSVTVAQSSATFSVGDVASATRYVSASTGLQSAAPTITWLSGLNYVIGTATGDSQIVLTTGGATLTAGIIYAFVLYTLA